MLTQKRFKSYPISTYIRLSQIVVISENKRYKNPIWYMYNIIENFIILKWKL